MIVIGLTGGIASGKSFVAQLLADRGAIVLDADRYAHEALSESRIRDAIIQRWGDPVAHPDGTLNRRAIAERIFGDDRADERTFLEALVHPRVRERLVTALEEARVAEAPAAVLDVPLLLEAGWADDCDVVLFVDTPEAVRRSRAANRGWAGEELSRRESAQAPLSVKRAASGAIIPGDDADRARAALASCEWAWWGQ